MVKGKGVPELEDREGWHGRAPPAATAEQAVAALGGLSNFVVRSPAPQPAPHRPPSHTDDVRLPAYAVGEKVATRKAFGDALAALGADPRVVVVDGEVSNSTHTQEFADAFPDRSSRCSSASRCSSPLRSGWRCAAMRRTPRRLPRSFPALMTSSGWAGISGTAIRLCGSHAGVEIGEDGPSQMGLEDLATLRAVHGSTVLYPSDATSAAVLAAAMRSLPGVSYCVPLAAPTRSCIRPERRSVPAGRRPCGPRTPTK
jgi:transketolase